VTDRDQSRDTLDRLTVAEAADRLGITEAGVRKRVQRGQISYDRDDRGRVWVWLSPDETRRDQSRDRDTQSRDELVEELRDQVRFLREELARKDALMLNMTQTMRQLTAPAEEEPSESPVTAESAGPREEPFTSEERPQEPVERPWWRRMFGT
jgi:hypothetical protein